MKMKEVCQRTGLTERAVRLYIAKGLVSTAVDRRSGRNFREFTEAQAHTLSCVAALRQVEFSLEEIRQMQENPEEIPSLVAAHRERLQQEATQRQTVIGCLEALHSKPENMERLAEELQRQQQRCALPNLELCCRFGAMDEEQAPLPPIPWWHRWRKRLLLGVAGVLAAVLVAGGWLYWQGSRLLTTLVPIPSVQFDEKWLDDDRRLTVRLRLLDESWLPAGTSLTLHLRGDAPGNQLYESILLGPEYMGATVSLQCSRSEARRQGLLTQEGVLDFLSILQDPALAQRYGTLIQLQGE